ncbi:hypothetical protein HHI36_012640 [Cryptolaemus montrouzieri]|uniref:Uncharacterized protein n=1 Tax=Cryptolaemus montrouzieri TaxID=559131 RepID=A0ABD2NF41_9CUCU
MVEFDSVCERKGVRVDDGLPTGKSGYFRLKFPSTTESVLQKFKKSISLRFQKKATKGCTSLSLDQSHVAAGISTGPSEEDNQVPSSSTQGDSKDEHSEQKPRFGSLIWRSSKERKRMNKAARNAKCNSGDSGIQIEMVHGCGGLGGDSSESHDTDVPADDFDSPPVVRRRPPHGKIHRPNSELLNQILIDKFKYDVSGAVDICSFFFYVILG